MSLQVLMWLYKAIVQIRQCFPVIIQGETPLHKAAENGYGTCCSILLSAGSNVHCTGIWVIVKKYFVDKCFESELVHLLLGKKQSEYHEKSTIFTITFQMSLQIMVWLYNAIFQIGQCFPVIIQGRTPLHWAAENGHGTCCSIFLSAGSHVDCTDGNVIVQKYLVNIVLKVI